MTLFGLPPTANYVPQGSVDELFPGTWYLTCVDEKYRRHYTRRSLDEHGPLEAGLLNSVTASEVCQKKLDGLLTWYSGMVISPDDVGR